jgi:hypothetical protein
MRYELIPFVIILAILLITGFVLIVDAGRRAIQGKRR